MTLAAAFGPRLGRVSTIAELAEDRVVEGVYAVARKRRLRTKNGSAYLALELVDPSGRIEGRVWNDVDLLDARFGEGDAVRVLGRVERYRDRLQLDVRSIEAGPGRPTRPASRRRCAATPTSSTASSSSSPARSPTPACRRPSQRILGDAEIRRRLRALPGRPGRPPRLRGRPARAHGRRRDDLPRALPAPPAPPRRPARSPPRSSTTSAARSSSSPGPGFRQTAEGRLLGHVHLGMRLIEERADALDADARAELLHAVASHHDARAAKTAEAAVLYHANQLDAVAATRPVDGT